MSAFSANDIGFIHAQCANINNLLSNFHFGKLGFGAPNKCLACKVEPISANYDTGMNLIWDKFGTLC